jgi:CMP-N,N'-diacetyllegionaminic acid synthase
MIGKLRVLAVIPARGGSKGLPGKNILPLGGQPLLAWTVKAAKASRCVDRVVLSSDDESIMAAAEAAGCDVPFRRDAALATDTASSIDVVLDALARLPDYDAVVLLQPTSPLRSAQDIDGALETMLRLDAPACVSVREAADHPFWTFRLDKASRLHSFVENPQPSARRQDLPQAWCLNGAVYAAQVDWLLAHKSFVSPQTVAFPMPPARSIDIDTREDFDQAARLIAGQAAS